MEDEERDTGLSGEEGGGGDTETLAVGTVTNGVTGSRRSLASSTARRHRKSCKSPLSLSEHDFCR